MVLGQTHGQAATAEHGAAVAEVGRVQQQVVHVGTPKEQEQRRRAVLVLLAAGELQQVPVGHVKGLLQRGDQLLGACGRVTHVFRRAFLLLPAAHHVAREVLGHVLCRVHPTVAVEDTEGRAELAQPLAVEDAILLAVLLALPRLSVSAQLQSNLILEITHRLAAHAARIKGVRARCARRSSSSLRLQSCALLLLRLTPGLRLGLGLRLSGVRLRLRLRPFALCNSVGLGRGGDGVRRHAHAIGQRLRGSLRRH
mmetsp:Transcript_15916/g.37693  ORF Transcript_15916/g.37693 Transcript_15916/m.37693 type:complete len:254 (-) Transcript_15916:591-1352(-)